MTPTPNPATLYVIEDHPLMREAVVRLLSRLWPNANVIGLDRIGGIENSVRQHGLSDLICLDLKLPDTAGTSGVHEMKNRFPSAPLAVLSASSAANAKEVCIEAGADIYISKSLGAREIGDALRALFVSNDASNEAAPISTLSTRHKQLLAMVARGLSNREIAQNLGIQEHTVKVHLWQLFRRLGVHRRAAAVHHARAHGLLGE